MIIEIITAVTLTIVACPVDAVIQKECVGDVISGIPSQDVCSGILVGYTKMAQHVGWAVVKGTCVEEGHDS